METRHEGQTGALPPADQADVVGMPLRAIADLHGAYGAGVELDMQYRPRDNGDELGHWIVRLTAEYIVPGTPGGPHKLTVTFFDSGRAYIRWGMEGAMFDRDEDAYQYRGFCLAVEAARVWLHQHGGKR